MTPLLTMLRYWLQESQQLPEKFGICLEYSRMLGCSCIGNVRCALQLVEETSNTYFDPCTCCFFTCIIKMIFHFRSLFFMVLLCTSLVQESISDASLVYDFDSLGGTLPLLGFLKHLIEALCIYLCKYLLLCYLRWVLLHTVLYAS